MFKLNSVTNQKVIISTLYILLCMIYRCTMRLGREYRYLDGGQPVWSAPFKMISGSGMIRVFVRRRDGRPEK